MSDHPQNQASPLELQFLTYSDPTAQANMMRHIGTVRKLFTGQVHDTHDFGMMIGTGFGVSDAQEEQFNRLVHADRTARMYIMFDVDDAQPQDNQRLYREEGLTVRRRKGRRRPTGSRAPAPVLAFPYSRWSLDFVHDQLVTGRQSRVLSFVDDVTRECIWAVVDTSIPGRRVVRGLADLIAERRRPKMIVSDNGTELTSNAVLAWSSDVGVEWHFIAPGKLAQSRPLEGFPAGLSRGGIHTGVLI